MNEIEPGVIYREGRPTAKDYEDAIESLRDASKQLEPDGHGCWCCGDSGHQAFECHHNPLIMARRALGAAHCWRCYHCDEVFTDSKKAELHFGRHETEAAQCVFEARDKAYGLLRKLIVAANDTEFDLNVRGAGLLLLVESARNLLPVDEMAKIHISHDDPVPEGAITDLAEAKELEQEHRDHWRDRLRDHLVVCDECRPSFLRFCDRGRDLLRGD